MRRIRVWHDRHGIAWHRMAFGSSFKTDLDKSSSCQTPTNTLLNSMSKISQLLHEPAYSFTFLAYELLS